MINLELHFRHTSEVLISNSVLICRNLQWEITRHWLHCHQFLDVPFTQHAAMSWWMCKYGCNEVHCDWNCFTLISTFWNPACAKFIYTFCCVHIKLLMFCTISCTVQVNITNWHEMYNALNSNVWMHTAKHH